MSDMKPSVPNPESSEPYAHEAPPLLEVLVQPPYTLSRIVLTGFMGAGKSTLGRKLAQRIGYTFIDTDILLTKEQGLNIPDIFAKHGEAHFRKLEAALFERVMNQYNIVVATGGGTLMAESSMALALDMSTVLWLKASPEVLYKRVSQSHKTHRPIMRLDDAEQQFHSLFQAREAFYAQSHIAIHTDRVPSSQHFPVDDVVDLLQLPKLTPIPEKSQGYKTRAASGKGFSHHARQHRPHG
jgi:shikimate kinase